MRKMPIVQTVAAAIALAATGTDMSYVKQGDGPYLWSNVSAWYDSAGETALGRLPTSSDGVYIRNAFDSDSPLRIGNGVSAATAAFETYGVARQPFFMTIEDGGSLASSGNAVWGRTAGTNVVTVEEGGSATFAANLELGRTDGNTTILTNRGEITASSLFNGDYNGALGIIENYGTFIVTGEDFQLGRSWGKTGIPTTGRLHLHQGSTFRKTRVDKFMYVGNGGAGELIVENTLQLAGGDQIFLANGSQSIGDMTIQGNGFVTNTGTSSFRVIAAIGSNSTARLTMKDNAFMYLRHTEGALTLASGEKSSASLSMTDNATIRTVNSGVRCCSGASSQVEIDMSGNSYLNSASTMQMAIEQDSTASLTLRGNAEFAAQGIKLGYAQGASATVDICDSACLTVQRQFAIGTTPGTTGICHVAGGKLNLRAWDPDESNHVIPMDIGVSGAVGILEGYGKFANHTWSPGNSSRYINTYLRGKMIADGKGVDRDLDPTLITIYNDVAEANANGDSGWYAQNGGRLFFPHNTAVSGGAVTIGDNAARETPELVNSFRVTLTGATDGYFLHSALYASDRTDLPGALPMVDGDIALGVWQMGYASGGQFTSTPSAVKTFTSADVTIRYGTSVLEKGRKYRVRALRWNGSAWVETTSFLATKASPNGLVTFSGLEPVSDGSKYNIGWTALVAQKLSRFTISIK